MTHSFQIYTVVPWQVTLVRMTTFISREPHHRWIAACHSEKAFSGPPTLHDLLCAHCQHSTNSEPTLNHFNRSVAGSERLVSLVYPLTVLDF